jgi:type III secretory pathway lipoprotein EscJ
VPCEPGKWRWADVTTDGYHRKSEAELQAMYERNRVLAEETRKRLRLVISVEQELQDVELVL